MKKEKILLISLIVTFIICVFLLTLVYLTTNKKHEGNIISQKDYYDVKFSNIIINLETDSYLIIDDGSKVLKLKIRNLNDFKKEGSFTLDLINIGTKNATVKEYIIQNEKSSDDLGKTNINISLEKDAVLKPNQRKKIKINIKYNGNNKQNPYYHADIKFIFK